ncbi:MAG: acyl-CoA synthetase (AMP-forming)/AMP-acid ligase II [Candidatus Azotimanducaceae bacterium]|jgi:acyl-CoA synthetase (AMP-forming)/AMP-acid ligase II
MDRIWTKSYPNNVPAEVDVDQWRNRQLCNLQCAQGDPTSVGVPDQNCGEAVMLFPTRTNLELIEKQVWDFCSGELTDYKKPKYVRFVDEMPKTNVGKILRRELRDEAVK